MAKKPTRLTSLKVDETITNATLTAALDALSAAVGKAVGYVKLGTVTHEDTSGEAKDMTVTVPAGCMITQPMVRITEAFNSGDSDTIAMGVSGDADALMATTDITAQTAGGYAKATCYATGETALTVQVTWTGAGTAATAGSADIYALYFEE